MDQRIVDDLVSIVGGDWVITEYEQIEGYLSDETPKAVAPEPDAESVLVKPADTSEIKDLLKYSNQNDIPLIPRGAGTGLCGAAVPTQPSIILAMERLDEILEIDQENMMVTCQAGAPLESLFESLEGTDLFFPPHPGDEGAQIGGLVVENAGGARAVKYGVMRNYVQGLKMVLPTGEQCRLGGKILKNNTGYNLLQLIIGSEGTLGILTEVTLRLYPAPSTSATLIASFGNRRDAVQAVPKILRSGVTPLAIEYVDRTHIEKSADHLGEEWPAQSGTSDLILIITGADEEELYRTGESISEVCTENGVQDILMAERSKEQARILDIRSNLYSTYQPDMAEDLDIAVPPASLADFLEVLEKVSSEFGVDIPTWGHAGDGNLHLHVMNEEGSPPDRLEELKDRLYTEAIELGGVISGEHGIGKTRKGNLSLMYSDKELELMRGIKSVFDPNGILNPGAVV